jgi:molybdopterin molybdotransferase
VIPLSEAVELVLARVAPLASVELPLADALGCVTAADVVADAAVPPFDNTAVDVFALRAGDVAGASPHGAVELRVIATLAAGAAPDRSVEAGTAIRIMTGAPLPAGADAVVMVERTSVRTDTDAGETVVVEEAV